MELWFNSRLVYEICLLQSTQTGSGAHPSLLANGYLEHSSLGVKMTTHHPPSSCRVKN